MSKIYIPTDNAEDWKGFLADPKKQWRTGFSAKTLAHCWQAAQIADDARRADGLPKEIASMLRAYGDKVAPICDAGA